MSQKEPRTMWSDVLRKNRNLCMFWGFTLVICGSVFLLYELPMEPFLYGAVLLTMFLLLLLLAGWIRERERARERGRIRDAVLTHWSELPDADTLAEADYQEMIRILGEQAGRLEEEFEASRREDVDYYTVWVHQIKTPIAVMRLIMGHEDTREHRDLEAELFRIEQYVDMVLQYVRLGSSSNDLVIREYETDALIRTVIRKFAPQFIHRRLKLEYAGTDEKIITDQKWFTCILEQILSNAIKYTPAGAIRIEVEQGELRISDTGIGIAPEDLPRIFERGYTGQNGRIGEKSSGLGLYLCKKAADLIAIPLRVESEVGKGSVFILTLNRDTELNA